MDLIQEETQMNDKTSKFKEIFETYKKAEDPLDDTGFGFDLIDGIPCVDADITWNINEGKVLARIRLDNAEIKEKPEVFYVKDGSRVCISTGADAVILISPTIYWWVGDDEKSLVEDFIKEVADSADGVPINGLSIKHAKFAHYSITKDDEQRLLSAWIKEASVHFTIEGTIFKGILVNEMIYPKEVD